MFCWEFYRESVRVENDFYLLGTKQEPAVEVKTPTPGGESEQKEVNRTSERVKNEGQWQRHTIDGDNRRTMRTHKLLTTYLR
jgi:hypothetical protein